MNDKVGSSLEGLSLSLADRIDSIVGLFGVGVIPTGSKDPYALRRDAISILTNIINNNLILDLNLLILLSFKIYNEQGKKIEENADKILDFFFERLRVFYKEIDIPSALFESVLAARPTRPLDFNRRILALNIFIDDPNSKILLDVYKRSRKIVKQHGISHTFKADPIPLISDYTKILRSYIEEAKKLNQNLDAFDYKNATNEQLQNRERLCSDFIVIVNRIYSIDALI